MSVIRLTGAAPGRLVALADKILNAWRGYTDEAAVIRAFTGDKMCIRDRERFFASLRMTKGGMPSF